MKRADRFPQRRFLKRENFSGLIFLSFVFSIYVSMPLRMLRLKRNESISMGQFTFILSRRWFKTRAVKAAPPKFAAQLCKNKSFFYAKKNGLAMRRKAVY